jgi:hypothetical protein
MYTEDSPPGNGRRRTFDLHYNFFLRYFGIKNTILSLPSLQKNNIAK